MRVFIALAALALLLAFGASLSLVATQSGDTPSKQPLVVYGSR